MFLFTVHTLEVVAIAMIGTVVTMTVLIIVEHPTLEDILDQSHVQGRGNVDVYLGNEPMILE